MEWEDREPPVILYERQSDRLYTHKETCEKLAISPATLNRLMRDGQIEYAKIKNAVRFSESAIREFIARSTKGTDT
jgi:excisionase family DNA binding protein